MKGVSGFKAMLGGSVWFSIIGSMGLVSTGFNLTLATDTTGEVFVVWFYPRKIVVVTCISVVEECGAMWQNDIVFFLIFIFFS